MGNDGPNCGMTWPLGDIDDATCVCDLGYVNDEGTGITGSAIKAGQALYKNLYQEHKDCEKCAHNPGKCEWRRKRLERSTSRTTSMSPPSGSFEFFVPSLLIDWEVIKAFLNFNTTTFGPTLLAGRRFRGEPGFCVESDFRFNDQDIRQLQQLSDLKHQGRDWKRSLRRIAKSASQPFTEFTRYLEHTRSQSANVSSKQQQLAERHSVSSARSPQSERERPDRSDRQGGSTRQPRHGHKDAQQTSDDVVTEVASATKHMSVSARSRRHCSPSTDSQYRISRERGLSDERVEQRDRRSRDQVSTEEHHHFGQSGHESHDPWVDSHAAISQDRPQHQDSRGERQYQGDNQDQSKARSHSRRSDQLEERQGVVIKPEPAARGSAHYSTSNSGRHARQEDRSSERLASYNSSSTYSMQEIGRKTSREDPSEDDAPTRRKNVRFFIPSAYIDLVVLAFYLKTVVDAGTQMERTTYNGKSGYMIDAKRALDRDELEDIMNDTKNWQKEQRQRRLPENAQYTESDTARQRKKRSG